MNDPLSGARALGTFLNILGWGVIIAASYFLFQTLYNIPKIGVGSLDFMSAVNVSAPIVAVALCGLIIAVQGSVLKVNADAALIRETEKRKA